MIYDIPVLDILMALAVLGGCTAVVLHWYEGRKRS